jgi:hypothetical protein
MLMVGTAGLEPATPCFRGKGNGFSGKVVTD